MSYTFTQAQVNYDYQEPYEDFVPFEESFDEKSAKDFAIGIKECLYTTGDMNHLEFCLSELLFLFGEDLNTHFPMKVKKSEPFKFITIFEEAPHG